jgi:hypothetical protein
MPIFYTDTGSLIRLEVTGSTAMSGSSNVLNVKGSGSAIMVVSGSVGGLVEISDIQPSGDLFIVASGSRIIFDIDNTPSVTISGSLKVSGSFSASLQSGYTWVGNSSGIGVPVPTSSIGGGGGATDPRVSTAASLYLFYNY